MQLRVRPRNVVIGIVVLLVGALVLPYINLSRYRRRVSAALSEALGRPVEVGGVHLQLLPTPGLVAENVVVGDLPTLSAEPLAHMSELRAMVRLRSLWTGRLSFSSVVCIEPSVNLSRAHFSASGTPNLPTPSAPVAAKPQEFPYIEFQDGRINFKNGDVKSVFFFSHVDAALYREGDQLKVRFRGTPSRTDRLITGAGEIRLEGALSPSFDLQARLSQAFLSDLLALARGADPGIQGRLGLDARIKGRPAALRFEGRAQVADLHRRDYLPPASTSSFQVTFLGSGDLLGRRLDLAQLRSETGAVTAFGSISGFLSEGRAADWDLNFRFTAADAERWFATLRHFSPRISNDLSVTGAMDGSVRFIAGPDGPTAKGELAVSESSVRAPGVSLSSSQDARLEFDGPIVRLHPLTLTTGETALTIAMVCDWTTPVRGPLMLQLSASGQAVPLKMFSPLAAAFGWKGGPEEGSVSLDAKMIQERDHPTAFAGWLSMTKVKIAPAWLPQPILVHTARLDMSARSIRVSGLVADVGESMFTGSLERVIGQQSTGPWQANLRVNEANAAAIGGLLGGVPPDASAPDLLGRLQARGKIAVALLHLRAWAIEDMQSSFVMADRRLWLSDAHARWAGGKLAGRVDLNFAHPLPEYEAVVKLTDVESGKLVPELAEGPISGALQLKAAGRTAADVAASLRLTGTFTGRSLRVKPDSLAQALRLDHVALLGADVEVKQRALHFSRLALTGPPSLEGRGTIGFDRVLDLDFRAFRLTGTLAEPQRVEPE